MPVLLLTQGDAKAKELLRQAIEARYSIRPPAIERLKLSFTGRMRMKLGPVNAWIPLRANAFFQFPTAMRWEYAARLIGIPIRLGVEALDRTAYQQIIGTQKKAITDRALIESAQRRMWATAAAILTPLSDHFVKVVATSDHSFDAVNTQTGDVASVHLRPDWTVDRIIVVCTNPENHQEQTLTLRLSEEQFSMEEMVLPKIVSMFWDDAPYMEVTPVKMEINPELAAGVFTLTASH